MASSITFGRYSPYPSFTHKLDPRNKIFLVILLMVAIFFKIGNWSTTLILTGVYLILFIIIMIISHVNFLDLFKSLKNMWFFIIFIFAVYIFIPVSDSVKETSQVAFYISGSYGVYWESIFQAIYIVVRLALMISLMIILTSTTKPMDLTYAFEWYMTPLKVIHFPASEIAMVLSIALRFIPTLLDEVERIKKAQASRGVDFNGGGLIKKFKAIISLIIPLFISSIDRSEQLADAMEARGYNPKEKRTRYRILRFGLKDLFAFVLVGCIFAGILTMYIFDNNGYPINILNYFFGIETIF